ncbi:protein WVD2-like 5 [Senna tora]|uniref:Protein WVD2-like 5 n=1 Tax=Senna tora TaxID=362788 RepID=A0A834TX29_9FABA|nr:protein WVD2-like 5 [Senna tora]
MMDPSNHSLADGLEAIHQNGIHEEAFNSGKGGVVSNDINPNVAEITDALALNGDFENVVKLDDTATNDSCMGEIKEGSIDNVKSINVTISKEEEVKITIQTKQSRASKGPIKNKNVKPPSPKVIYASGPKKNKDGKDEEAPSGAPNGSLALNNRSRQPIKSRSFNEKQTQVSNESGKSDAAPAEAPMDKKIPKLSRKEPVDEVQGEEESSFTIAEDTKPRRAGALPNYGFSFKCDERAEKRKEFYTKLEEKIHAKEVEKSNLQAKTKETQEAEIKMLRKSLNFKATPMPSFYQEPPPPKVELKKIPTTRAKSPKLGRKKSSSNSEAEGNTGSSSRQGRLSLDEKASQSNFAKVASPVHQKKPQRKSLPPRLQSERTSSSNSKIAGTSAKPKAINERKTIPSVPNKDSTMSNATGEENSTVFSETGEAAPHMEELNALLSDMPSEVVPPVNGDTVVEEQPQLASVQGPIASEH